LDATDCSIVVLTITIVLGDLGINPCSPSAINWLVG
jgi:hypothetical protein